MRFTRKGLLGLPPAEADLGYGTLHQRPRHSRHAVSHCNKRASFIIYTLINTSLSLPRRTPVADDDAGDANLSALHKMAISIAVCLPTG